MTLTEWLEESVGLSIVEVALLDHRERRVTAWTGRVVFLEYVASPDGTFRQSEAWSVAKAPKDVSAAMATVLDRRQRAELA